MNYTIFNMLVFCFVCCCCFFTFFYLHARAFTHGTSVRSLIRRTCVEYRVCLESWLRGNSPTVDAQSQARKGHLSTRWPDLIVLKHGFRVLPVVLLRLLFLLEEHNSLFCNSWLAQSTKRQPASLIKVAFIRQWLFLVCVEDLDGMGKFSLPNS